MHTLKIQKGDLYTGDKNYSSPKEMYLNTFVRDRLIIVTHSNIHLLPLKEIIYIQAESNYSKIVLANGKSLLVTSTLKQIESRLQNHPFCRIHASYLINLLVLHEIKKNGEYKVLLTDGSQLPISGKYRDSFLKIFLLHKL